MTKQKDAATLPAQQTAGPVTMHEPAPVFDQDAGAGFEGTGREDMAIPFLVILQSGSPQCKRSEGAYIEGAGEGMLFNTVTGQVIDTGKKPLIVVPCAYSRAHVEWRLRENGGGFVREHKNVDPALLAATMRDEKNRDILPNGNQINDTRAFYVLVLDEDGSPTPGVISMTSTQIRKAKQWLMQQNLLKLKGASGNIYTPPMFASKWAVTTVPESNEKGAWMGWKFEHAGYLSGPLDPVYIAARDFHKAVSAGEVAADMSRSVDPETGEIRNGGHKQPAGHEEDEIQY